MLFISLQIIVKNVDAQYVVDDEEVEETEKGHAFKKIIITMSKYEMYL